MEASMNEIICPFETEWKFQKADLMALKESENGFLKGKYFYAFNILGLQYYIKICPNGDNEESRKVTWIFLNLNGSNERKIAAEFTQSVESADYSESVNYVYEKIGGYGSTCCKTAEFFDSKNKYFVNGEITIKVKGTFKAKRPLIPIISSPISMQWKIKEEILKESQNEYLYSKPIKVASFSGVEYYFLIFPNEIEDGKPPQTFLYLKIKMGNEKKIEAVCDFSVDSANLNVGFECVFEKSGGWGKSLCLTDDLFDPLKGFIVDGYLTINFNGILLIEKNECSAIEKNQMTTSFQNNQNQDFTIIIGEKEIKVHKQVLMDASPVLAAMLESGLKESTENKMTVLDFSFEIVEAAIKLCYNRYIPLNFTLEDALSIYRFADKYQMKLIMDSLENFLIEKLSSSNVVQLVYFSKEFAIKKLHQSCVDLLIKCSKESTPVYGSKSLDKDLLAMMFLSTLRSIDVTDNTAFN
uniref:BTB domain-containing protein n=1 Tax=Panagrolaimus superbus TaxID=310955 RepID=A0A914YFE0_9BILA